MKNTQSSGTMDRALPAALLEIGKRQRELLCAGMPLRHIVEAMLDRLQEVLPQSAVAVLWTESVQAALHMPPMTAVPAGFAGLLADAIPAGEIRGTAARLAADEKAWPDAICRVQALHRKASSSNDQDMRVVPVTRSTGEPVAIVLAAVPGEASDASVLTAYLAAVLGAEADRHLAQAALEDAQRRLAAVFDGSGEAIALADPQTETFIDGNPVFRTLLGYDRAEIDGLPFAAVAVGGPCLVDAAADAAASADAAGPLQRLWLRRKDRSIFPAEYAVRTFVSQGRSLLCFSGRDVSQRFQDEGKLLLAAKLFDSMREGALVIDSHRRIASVNPAFLAMTGYETDELIGKEAGFLYEEADSWWQVTQRSFDSGEACEHELHVRKKGGQIFPCRLSLSVVGKAALASPRLIVVHKDVTQNRRTENHLHFLANHDVLTRLPNRMQFYKRLDQAVVHAANLNRSFAVLFIDLDRFKNINDTFGHSAGDLLLQMVSDRLGRHIRKNDLLARLGGDEFTVLAEYMPDIQDVVALAEHVMSALNEPFYIEGHELFVTASIGISVYPHDGRDTETLIRSADAAMYHAKSQGKNNYQFFLADMHAKPLEHLMLENALRHALDRGEFLLYYQPKVDTSTEYIFGMEALLRWNHPTLGIVAPGRFIPLAEETGLIREIGSWALREACRQTAIWRRAGYRSLVVSVNLSMVQLMSPDFAGTVAGILKDTGLDAACLELELTESAIMESPEQNSRTLQALRNMGVKISIDDFGTGYSSLNYLKRFPISTLKIDQSFVRDINVDANDAAITGAVISLAHSLKMSVIAEGVETPEQLRYLQRNGCNAYQGFLFSRPLPSAEFQQLLTAEPHP